MTQILGKKWYNPLFSNILNTSLILSWWAYLGRISWQQYDLSKFLLQNHMFSQIYVSFLSINMMHTHVMPCEIRYNRLHHFLAFITQRRYKICHKSTRIYCTKCNVWLELQIGYTNEIFIFYYVVISQEPSNVPFSFKSETWSFFLNNMVFLKKFFYLINNKRTSFVRIEKFAAL